MRSGFTLWILMKCKNRYIHEVYTFLKYSIQGTTQGNGLTGGVLPVRFSM